MSRVTRCLLNKLDAEVSTPISEGFNLKKSASYFIRYFPISVTQDDVDTDFLNTFNLVTTLAF